MQNLGKEDRFYIKAHHEPIVSEKTFARVQEIRKRRNGGRKTAIPGKREKFSRQCVKSTKHGKRYCPDSKGIPGQVIEESFIESYQMLCADNKDVLEEFISRVEKTLSEDSVRDKLLKYQNSADNLQVKRKSLLEKYLEGIVSQDINEEMDVGYERKLSDIKENIVMLEQQMEDEVSLKRRVAEFKKALSKKDVLQELDRGIFESLVIGLLYILKCSNLFSIIWLRL